MLQCTRGRVHFTHQLRCGQASRRARPPRLKFFSHAITIARTKRGSGGAAAASSAMKLHARRPREQKKKRGGRRRGRGKKGGVIYCPGGRAPFSFKFHPCRRSDRSLLARRLRR